MKCFLNLLVSVLFIWTSQCLAYASSTPPPDEPLQIERTVDSVDFFPSNQGSIGLIFFGVGLLTMGVMALAVFLIIQGGLFSLAGYSVLTLFLLGFLIFTLARENVNLRFNQMAYSNNI